MESKTDIIKRIETITGTRHAHKLLTKKALYEMLNDLHTPHTLHLHESYFDKRIWKDILRVPSGWLYSNYNAETDTCFDSVFVPYGISEII